MSDTKKIHSALISVFSKDGLEPLLEVLNNLNVTIYSTGGTETFIKNLGYQVVAVEELTSYPSILGGRVKTLHPKIFGGILNRQHIESDIAEIETYNIPQIDLVIVDLYPFENTVASGAGHQDIIEKIDIGGISLIRAAAKNYEDVTCIASVEDYKHLTEILKNNEGHISKEQRAAFAAKAFNVSSHYDTAIYKYLKGRDLDTSLKISETKSQSLRYGENPHQKGSFFGDFDAMFTKIHGKELSYNNLLDVDAAVNLMNEFKDDAPTFAILKHNNACGVATRATLTEAYEAALAGDPVSAFGGILITNKIIDKDTASAINNLFCEVVIAPDFSDEAIEILSLKKNRILLIQKDIELPVTSVRSCLNGYLVQDRDLISDSAADLSCITNSKPTPTEIEDLIFASKICKHTKSNTIVLAKNKQLCASGTGQTSRVDALNQAIHKAKSFNFNLNGAVMASDAFFPFPDCVEIADHAGITAVIQPGGSIKDDLSIEYCDKNNISMVFTGIRHFKH